MCLIKLINMITNTSTSIPNYYLDDVYKDDVIMTSSLYKSSSIIMPVYLYACERAANIVVIIGQMTITSMHNYTFSIYPE